MTTLPPPPTVVATQRTARATLKECEAALAAARSNNVTPLAEIVDRERHWFARCALRDVSPDTSVSRWLARKFAHAAHDRNLADFRLLIEVGAHEAARHRGIVPLHVAARYGFSEGAELLIAAGADLMAVTEKKSTPLHFASQQAQTTMIAILAKHGASINPLDGGNMTPIQRLLNSTVQSLNNDAALSALKLLLQSGAHTTATRPSYPPLHLAIRNTSVAAVATLVDHGADVNATDRNGGTPLHSLYQSALSLSGKEAMVSCLVRHGANPKARDSQNLTPAECAARSQQRAVAHLLIRYGGYRSRQV